MGYDAYRRPAEFAAAEARRRTRVIATGFVLYFLTAVACTLLVLAHDLPPLALVAAALAVALVRPTVDAYLNRQVNWEAGAIAEQAVGDALNELRREGWIVMHDIERQFEGNVDHLLSGPGGVFLVETKLRRYEDAHLAKAKRQAARIGGELGVWVTPVIALHKRSNGKCFKHKGVWIAPRQLLLAWLREQRNPTLDFEALARWADKL